MLLGSKFVGMERLGLSCLQAHQLVEVPHLFSAVELPLCARHWVRLLGDGNQENQNSTCLL